MSRTQFHSIESFILRHAWLNLWDKRMTTGRINQIAIHFNPFTKLFNILKMNCQLNSHTKSIIIKSNRCVLRIIITNKNLRTRKLVYFLSSQHKPFHEFQPVIVRRTKSPCLDRGSTAFSHDNTTLTERQFIWYHPYTDQPCDWSFTGGSLDI